MSIQPIRLFGDPVLVTPAAEVVDFDKELRKLVADLTDTMLEAPGAGLAAPQIGVSLRVFVWDVDDELGHLINPTLDLSEELQDGEEGCLSFPGIYVKIKRPTAIKARWQNSSGEWEEGEFDGYNCKCFLHEFDHLEGITYQDRVSTLKWALALKKLNKRKLNVTTK